jgi:hypothetical protein
VRLAKEAVKAGKGTKEAADAAVKELLAIKAEYKALTGADVPKAGGAPAASSDSKSKKGGGGSDKSEPKVSGGRAPSSRPPAAAAAAAHGGDDKAAAAAAAPAAAAPSPAAAAIIERHTAQGEKVRLAKEAVKAGTGTKDAVDAGVKELLAIKAEYKVRRPASCATMLAHTHTHTHAHTHTHTHTHTHVNAFSEVQIRALNTIFLFYNTNQLAC